MSLPYHGSGKSILIYPERDSLLPDYSKTILKDRYMLKEEKSPQEAFARASCAFGSSNAHAQRLYDYASQLWFGFASPLLSNGGHRRGKSLSISCFLQDVADSINDLAEKSTERKWMSVMGGAIGSNVSKIRPAGSPIGSGEITSPGMIPHLKEMEASLLAYVQSGVRRGAVAAYCDMSHPEIESFINIRKPNGDNQIKCLSEAFHHAVNITDDFMQAVKEDKSWNLIDPHTQKVTKAVKAKDLWIKLLMTRIEIGEPYFHFIDTANRALPKELKNLGLQILTSNLCQEIELPTAEDRSAVCCLSSMNLAKYDDWKDDELFIPDLMEMLDNALEDFIQNAPKSLWRAVNSAKRERSVGLGVMGFHTFLQSKMVPFESAMASSWNRKIFQHIHNEALKANYALGKSRGEAPDMKGSGKRFAHCLALAPTATNADICGGVSPSIEPWVANAFTRKTLSGSTLYKNAILETELEKLGLNTSETWTSIIQNEGSVQHLDIQDEIKDVFKTAHELDQMWIIDHAASRQPFICQGQSLNLFFSSSVDKKYLHAVHWAAWEKGLKGLYYLRPKAMNRAMTSYKENGECLACQG